MVKVPVSVALNASLSEEPAVLDVTLKDPLKLNVPETPLYLPEPPVTFATPFTLTLVGVLVPAAQPWELAEVTTWNINLLPAPVMLPSPDSSSHWFDAAAEPVAEMAPAPTYVPGPLPRSEVTFTVVAACPVGPTMRSAIVPLYDPRKATFFVFTA